MNDRSTCSTWKIRAALALTLAALAGCGGKVVVDGGRGDGTLPGEKDVCELGAEHLAECVPIAGGGGGELGECSGTNECAFACILDADCDTLLGSDLAGAQQLAACLLPCGGTD